MPVRECTTLAVLGVWQPHDPPSVAMHCFRVASRFNELALDTVVVSPLEVVRNKLPPALKAVQLHSLPTVVMLPARSKVRS